MRVRHPIRVVAASQNVSAWRVRNRQEAVELRFGFAPTEAAACNRTRHLTLRFNGPGLAVLALAAERGR